ncbi:chloride channel protein [Ideonella sp.]|uniref:chloride channel protein n=1 Tax=Ideonella sp. TaxID=1929293 RepID=UPI0035B2B6E7
MHLPIHLALRREFGDVRRWQARLVVLAAAVLAGLSVVAFTWVTERALELFFALRAQALWLPLLWVPAGTAAIVWLTRRFAPGAAGSGIPQVMAALETPVTAKDRPLFVSLKLAAAKFVLTAAGLLCGLSLGREGPSVQLAAGVMHHARRWLPERSPVTEHGLLVAGGAAGIAAAFNTPLAGIMFAIEELSRKPEQRSSGLLVAAIVLAGLMAVSVYGNATYFGVIQSRALSLDLLWPATVVALASGLAGGLFARLLLVSLAGEGGDRASRWRRASPVRFACACGLAIATIGFVTDGATFGSGYLHSREMLAGSRETPGVFVLFKFLATWLTAWAGVPGGIFAPSLAIGGALGNDIAALTGFGHAPTLIALGMVGFLAAATQAPLTSFIIVMEMVDGHGMVLSLMACALVASAVSRVLGRPLYGALAALQLARLPSALPPPAPPASAMPPG